MMLVFGSTGQVASALKSVLPDETAFLDREGCDLADLDQVRAALGEYQPDVIINAAAYTAVDKAENEPELAHAINADAVTAMAEYVRSSRPSPQQPLSSRPEAAQQPERRDLPQQPLSSRPSPQGERRDLKLIHLSTDFVFDGTRTTPYKPGDATNPLGEYAQSKLQGELYALQTAPENTMIMRTSWVYSEQGSNFVKTMLRLMAERDELGVVNDQRGSPTYAPSIAEVIAEILDHDLFKPGIYHWTDAGDITWYDFAVAIQEEALESGLLDRKIPINPITTDDYPTPAERPAYSVLDNSKMSRLVGLDPVPWRDNLRLMLSHLDRA